MNFANLEYRHIRLSRARSQPRRNATLPRERDSDCRPDISTELASDELEIAQQSNRPITVLKEAAGAVLYSMGLVFLLITILQWFDAG